MKRTKQDDELSISIATILYLVVHTVVELVKFIIDSSRGGGVSDEQQHWCSLLLLVVDHN